MPRVSMALPCYNGENFVGGAIESLLAQTFTDFELLIVDNASTDRTQEICEGFAARDPRVRYHRNPTNIGLGPNWNLAFDLVTPAPYFKWVAHDDRHAPAFLERCVEALDRDPGVIVAFTQAEFIDPEGKTVESRPHKLPLDSPDPAVRFDALMPSDRLFIFGVMRRENLMRMGKPVIGSYVDNDGVLLLKLLLEGRFYEVPELLFFNRIHPAKAETRFAGDDAAWSAWMDPGTSGQRVFPQWRRQAELWRGLMVASMSTRDRIRCARVLARWTRWQRGRLYREVVYNARDVLRSFGRRARQG